MVKVFLFLTINYGAHLFHEIAVNTFHEGFNIYFLFSINSQTLAFPTSRLSDFISSLALWDTGILQWPPEKKKVGQWYIERRVSKDSRKERRGQRPSKFIQFGRNNYNLGFNYIQMLCSWFLRQIYNQIWLSNNSWKCLWKRKINYWDLISQH